MPLGIYKDESDSSSLVSSDDSTNPITFNFSNAGGTEERQLYLRHANLSGDGAESSTNATVDPIDIETTMDDVSTWIEVAPDSGGSAGTYAAAGASVNLGNVNLGDAVPFWIRVTVPSNSEMGARDDLRLKLTADTNTLSREIDLSVATFSGDAYFDGFNNRIEFRYLTSADTGQVLTDWIDVSSATQIEPAKYTITGGTVYLSYRVADDSSGTNASAWVLDPNDLNLAQTWLQIRFQFYGEGAHQDTQFVYVEDNEWVYSGEFSDNFDIRFWNGPATPELVSPENGSDTDFFQPELTAVSARCDALQFQLDSVSTFDSSNLQTWEVIASDDVEATTQPPSEIPDDGVVYWRARSKLEGIYGNWSDYWILTVNPLPTEDKFIYINVNLGSNANVIDNDRFYYLNVNVDFGFGEVLYPFLDQTEIRKETFDYDSNVF